MLERHTKINRTVPLLIKTRQQWTFDLPYYNPLKGSQSVDFETSYEEKMKHFMASNLFPLVLWFFLIN
jgi:hypothetical protein